LPAAVEAAECARDAPQQLNETLLRKAGDARVGTFALDALTRPAAKAGESTGAMTLLGNADARVHTASHFTACSRGRR
jgi:hypothetical protein